MYPDHSTRLAGLYTNVISLFPGKCCTLDHLVIFAAMHIDIISVLPELLECPFALSILKRQKDKGLLQIEVHLLRK